jgi:hypothetical protein
VQLALPQYSGVLEAWCCASKHNPKKSYWNRKAFVLPPPLELDLYNSVAETIAMENLAETMKYFMLGRPPISSNRKLLQLPP